MECHSLNIKSFLQKHFEPVSKALAVITTNLMMLLDENIYLSIYIRDKACKEMAPSKKSWTHCVTSHHHSSNKEQSNRFYPPLNFKSIFSRCCFLLQPFSSSALKTFSFSYIFSYLKDLIGDTCQRSIAAERPNFKDVDAPRIDVVKHRTQSGLVRRLYAVNRQAIARKRVGVHQRTLEAWYLRHCAWRPGSLWVSRWCGRSPRRLIVECLHIDFLLFV